MSRSRGTQALALVLMSVFVVSAVGAVLTLNAGTTVVGTAPSASLTSFGGATCTVTVTGENLANDAVQTAITSAANGSTICISAGVYPEQLTISSTSDLTLLGAGNASTMIEPTSVSANGVDLDTGSSAYAILGAWSDSGLVLQNFTVNGGAALSSVENNCGAQYYGVYLGDSSANLFGLTVTDITSNGGCQGQSAIYADTGFFQTSVVTDQAISVTNSTVTGFGKNGITCDDLGVTCTVANNTVAASAMALGYAATNGIQFWGAAGTISHNTVTGNDYLPGACLEQNYFSSGAGCASPYWSGGILVLSAPSVVNVSGNTLSGNQVGLWSLGGPVSAWSNDFVSAGYYGIVLDFNATDVGGPSAVYAATPFTDLVGDNTLANGNVGVLVFDDNATLAGNHATNVNVSYEVATSTGATFHDALVDNTAQVNVTGALLGNVSAFQPGAVASETGVFTVTGNSFTNVSTASPASGATGIALTGAWANVSGNTLTGFTSGASAVVGPWGNVTASDNTITGPAVATAGYGAYVYATNASVTGNAISGYSWMNGPGWWPNSQASGLFAQCLETCTVSHNDLSNNAIGIAVLSYAYGPSPAPGWPFAATPSEGPITVSDNTVTASGAFGIALELNQETNAQTTAPNVVVRGNTVDNTLTGAVGLMVDQGSYTIGANTFVGTSTSGSSGASQPTGEGSIATASIQVLDAFDSETVAALGGDQFVDTSVPLAVLNVTTAPPYEVVLLGNVVTFTETGLPGGTAWQVTIDSVTYSSTTASITIDLGPGAHSYTVGAVTGYATPAGSSVTVGLTAQTVSVAFVAVYGVTFTESGLAVSTPWSVTLGATTHSGSGTAIAFSEENGTYAYTVGDVAGYHLLHETGSVAVSGAAVGRHLSFVRTTYLLSFKESGLPAATSWSVTIDGTTTLSGTTRTLSTYEPNGTYSYVLGLVPGYVATESGSIGLNGGPSTVLVHFTPKTYLVTFSEHGLPHGTSWSVQVNGGAFVSSTTGLIFLREKNGSSYAYVLGDVPGWKTTTERGTFSVSGGPTSVAIPFTPVTYTVTFHETGLPHGTDWQATIHSTTKVGTLASLTFQVPNGTWSFTVVSTGYTATPGSGSITVSGAAPPTQDIVFS
jgi:hypothetical protein